MGRPIGARGRPTTSRSLELSHVFGGRPLLSLYDFELHRIAFTQALEAFTLDRRVVDEAVPCFHPQA